jgi:hypothetical protein
VSAGVYQSFPYDLSVLPTADELCQVLGMRGLAARHACPLTSGVASYQLIVDDAHYGLASLSGKARNQTRRGLENCSVRQVGFEELERAGALALSRDTLNRQGSSTAANHDRTWQRYLGANRIKHTQTKSGWK